MNNRRTFLSAMGLLLCLNSSGLSQAAATKVDDVAREQRLKWWTDARFGLFIHWGLYAETGRTTNVKSAEGLSDAEYQQYFDTFNPDLYNPKEWARAARNAGMRYVVITAKHQEGFCLWDSKYTDYKITNTPYKKDALKPFVEAFRNEGLKVGFYYSGADWHHPDLPIGYGSQPMSKKPAGWEKMNEGRDIKKYVEYAQNQLGELLKDFGKIDLLWSDYGADYSKNGDEDGLVRLIRGQQPHILLNDRFFKPVRFSDLGWKWDYRSPEQTMPIKWMETEGKKVPWELCDTMEGYWGYGRDVPINYRHGWKRPRQLLVLLIESVSKGGNLLLNIGPTARGTFNRNSMERLEAMGAWMKEHSRAIYGCTAAPPEFKTPANSLLTYNPETKRVYVHLLEWPTRLLHLDGAFHGKVKAVRLLNDSSEVLPASRGAWSFVWDEGQDILGSDARAALKTPGTFTLKLPIVQPDVEIPVIELILK
jgi:alpha-L-fucosidase